MLRATCIINLLAPDDERHDSSVIDHRSVSFDVRSCPTCVERSCALHFCGAECNAKIIKFRDNNADCTRAEGWLVDTIYVIGTSSKILWPSGLKYNPVLYW